MIDTFKALSLSTINATGTSERALYSALTTDMFFGQKSPLTLRVDEGLTKPYFTVPLPVLEAHNVAIKKQLLLISCLQETAKKLNQLSSTMPINTIEQLIIVTSMFDADLAISDSDQGNHVQGNGRVDNDSASQEKTDNTEIDNTAIKNAATAAAKKQWQQNALASINDYLPGFTNKVCFTYAHTPSLDQTVKQCITAEKFQRPVLVINIDSLLDHNNVIALNNWVEVQCLQGPAGIMPSEGATSTLLIPQHYPEIKNNQIVCINALDNALNNTTNKGLSKEANSQQHLSINAQLIQAQFSLPSTVLHVGTVSEQWVMHWYAQSNSFYHQKNAPLISQTQASQTAISQTPIPKQLTVYDQTKTLGYLGSANLTTAIASASALLASPIETIKEIWVIEHQINSNNSQNPVANVYKITSAISE